MQSGFCFALACEFKDDNEQMILLGNAERILLDDLPAARRHYESKHRLHLGWDEKKSPFKVVRIIEE